MLGNMIFDIINYEINVYSDFVDDTLLSEAEEGENNLDRKK